jgi:hypothetical protein
MIFIICAFKNYYYKESKSIKIKWACRKRKGDKLLLENLVIKTYTDEKNVNLEYI